MSSFNSFIQLLKISPSVYHIIAISTDNKFREEEPNNGQVFYFVTFVFNLNKNTEVAFADSYIINVYSSFFTVAYLTRNNRMPAYIYNA